MKIFASTTSQRLLLQQRFSFSQDNFVTKMSTGERPSYPWHGDFRQLLLLVEVLDWNERTIREIANNDKLD